MRNQLSRVFQLVVLSMVSVAIACNTAVAQKKYDFGANDTEIRLGGTMPYSGPASAYSGIGKTETEYFRMINEQGGINGRKIVFLSYDDATNPSKTVEQVRKLVESDEVLAIVNPFGTAGNLAVQKYMNQRKVPQLFVAAGSSKFADPKNFPWTMAWQPSFQTEARVHARYILKNYPSATVGVLYQNDDGGKDYIRGLRDALGEKAAKIIVAEAPYEIGSPTIDSQIIQIKSANPDIFINLALSKAASQAIKKVAELGWKPVQFLTNASLTISGTMKPAGFENSQGTIGFGYMKDPADPYWDADAGMREYKAFMEKYYPEGNRNDYQAIYGYSIAKTVVQVLKQCGDDLTRENVMKQAASLDFDTGVYFPGIRVQTAQDDYAPVEQFQPIKFEGENWKMFGSVVSGSERE